VSECKPLIAEHMQPGKFDVVVTSYEMIIKAGRCRLKPAETQFESELVS
jgi:hypothetical protein